MNSTTDEPGRGTLLRPQFELQGGERSVAQLYTAPEPIILVVRDDEGSSPASSNVLNVIPGNPTALRLSSDLEWVRGNRNATISALLVDQFDDGVPGDPAFFDHVSGSGTLTPMDQETDATATSSRFSTTTATRHAVVGPAEEVGDRPPPRFMRSTMRRSTGCILARAAVYRRSGPL